MRCAHRFLLQVSSAQGTFDWLHHAVIMQPFRSFQVCRLTIPLPVHSQGFQSNYLASFTIAGLVCEPGKCTVQSSDSRASLEAQCMRQRGSR